MNRTVSVLGTIASFWTALIVAGPPRSAATTSFVVPVLVLDGDSGTPIKGAALSFKTNSSWMYGFRHEETASGATSPDGRAAVTLPREAFYDVLVEAPGYEYASFAMLLRKGKPAEFLIVLERGATVTGRVLSEDGTPLPGAEVSVFVHANDRTDLVGAFAQQVRYQHLKTTADAEGAYTLSGFPPASHIMVDALHPCFVSGSSREFRIEAKERLTGIDVILRPATCAIEGVVLDENGRGVADAKVCVSELWEYFLPSSEEEELPPSTPLDEAMDEALGPIGPFETTTETGPGGQFRAAVLSPGEYHVVSTKSNRTARTKCTLTTAAPKQRVELRFEPRAIEPAPRSSRTITGTVVDPSGQPVSAVRVWCSTTGAECETGSGGEFTLAVPQEGSCIIFKKVGFLAEQVAISAQLAGPFRVVVHRLAILNVQLELLGGAEGLIPPFNADVHVSERLSPADPERGFPPSHAVSYGEQDFVQEGRGFFAHEVPPGDATVWVRVPGFVPERRSITLGPGEEGTVRIQLRHGGTVGGRVIRLADGHGIDGARISLIEGDGFPRLFTLSQQQNSDFAQVYSGSDGSFVIPGLPAEVRWRLWAFARGYGTVKTPLFAADLSAVALELKPEARVHGKLLHYEPPERGRISATIQWESFQGAETYAEVGGDGSFSAGELASGNYVVDCLGAVERVSIQAGEHRDVSLDLTRITPLRCRLLRGEKPLAEACVVPDAGTVKWMVGGADAETDRDGIFSLPRGSRGQTRLAISLDTFSDQDGEVKEWFEPACWIFREHCFEDRTVNEIVLGDCAVEGRIVFEGAASPEGVTPLSCFWPDDGWRGCGGGRWVLRAAPARDLDAEAPWPREGSYAIAQSVLISPDPTEEPFRVDGLFPGTYVLQLKVNDPYRSVTSDPITLAAGEIRRGVTLTCPRDPEATEAPRVRFVDAGGRGIGGVNVHFLHPSFASTESGDSGWARFQDVRPGRYVGIARPALGPSDLPETLFELTVPMGGPTEVTMRPGGRVLVQAVNGRDSPVAGASVSLLFAPGIDYLDLRHRGVYGRLTDAAGRVWIENVAPGRYECTARRKNTRSAPISIEVGSGSVVTVRLSLD